MTYSTTAQTKAEQWQQCSALLTALFSFSRVDGDETSAIQTSQAWSSQLNPWFIPLICALSTLLDLLAGFRDQTLKVQQHQVAPMAGVSFIRKKSRGKSFPSWGQIKRPQPLEYSKYTDFQIRIIQPCSVWPTPLSTWDRIMRQHQTPDTLHSRQSPGIIYDKSDHTSCGQNATRRRTTEDHSCSLSFRLVLISLHADRWWGVGLGEYIVCISNGIVSSHIHNPASAQSLDFSAWDGA